MWVFVCVMCHDILCFSRVSGSGRSVFQETRLCLAMLYGLLFQYRLREAQALGDCMARLVLDPAPPRPQSTDPTEGLRDTMLSYVL